MSLFQAEKLIDLACSTTHHEEARTAALTACRLIRKLGLRLTEDPQRTVARPSRRQSAPQPPVREKPPNGGTWTRATRSGRCESCGERYAVADQVYVVAGVVWCSGH
jgi:hypothetical protein